MNTRARSDPPRAFTHIELLVVLTVVGLLAALALPALGVSPARSARLSCLNNLRQIGRALQMRALDHNGEYHWRIPQSDGGVLGSPFVPDVWYDFSWVSNQLVTPRILVCPSDATKQKWVAVNWGLSPNGGFLNVAYRNNAVSYPLWVHTSPLIPQAVVSGDRNLAYSGMGTCGIINANNVWMAQRGDANVAWTNAIHGVTGNLLFNDGHVLQSTSEDLRNALNVTNVEASTSFHLLAP